MTRWRHPGTNEILLVYVLLAALAFLCSLFTRGIGPQYSPWAFPAIAFAAWRVGHGGRVSRMLLIAASAASYAAAILALARLWDLPVISLVVIGAAQVTLLFSPPVYGRTRRPALIPTRERTWGQLVHRPPAWLLPWGLLAGVLLTLALLGNMDFVAIAGCKPAGSGACIALNEGYPLRWLTGGDNAPFIYKAALLKDCVQWALASTSVLYLAWVWLTDPVLPD